MSVEEAKKHMTESSAKIKKKDDIIREKEKEILTLKLKLADAEKCVSRARAAKSRLESQNVEAMTMVKSDVELVLLKVQGTRTYGANEKIGRDAMDDMIALCDGDILGNEANILSLVDCIKKLGVSSVTGAIHSIMDAYTEQPSPTLAKAIRILYLNLLEKTTVNEPTTTWPLVADAMNIGVNELHDEKLISIEYNLLSDHIFRAVVEMKRKNDTMKSGRYYRPSEDKDPVSDLLLPTYNAIGNEVGGTTKAKLLTLMKNELIVSVNEVETAPTFAMPEEAAIAVKKGFPELQRFLLSPTETSLSLNLSKAGRMSVHRLIDYSMPNGKLDHHSEGSGRARYLVITKCNAEPPEMIQKRKERKEIHIDLLVKFGVFHKFIITMPPLGEKLGLTLMDNKQHIRPELKTVAPNSPIRSQIPEKFRKDVCFASMKSNATGFVRPKTAKEVTTMIVKANTGGSSEKGNTLELVLYPLVNKA